MTRRHPITRRDCLIALMLLPLAGSAQSARTPADPGQLVELAPDIRRIMERGALIVGMQGSDIAPYAYLKDGRLQGVDVELAQGLADELQVELRIDRSATSYNQVIDAVARGQVDIGVSALSRTFQRARRVSFSEPYVTLRHAMALNRANLAVLTRDKDARAVIKVFPGSIGILADSSYVEFAHRNFPAARIVEFRLWAEAVEAARKGTVDALYNDEFEIRYLMKSDAANPLFFRTAFFSDLVDTLAIALPHGSRQLLSFTNLYLSGRPRAPTAEMLLQRSLKR